MRESRTYGFVRGAHSNMRPYRDPQWFPNGSGTFGKLLSQYHSVLTTEFDD